MTLPEENEKKPSVAVLGLRGNVCDSRRIGTGGIQRKVTEGGRVRGLQVLASFLASITSGHFSHFKFLLPELLILQVRRYIYNFIIL